MPQLSIQGELRVPSGCMQGGNMEDVERLLQEAGLMPATVTERRWRLDHDSPGGYIVSFVWTVPEEPEA
jgi:hypothetical protein